MILEVWPPAEEMACAAPDQPGLQRGQDSGLQEVIQADAEA